MQCWVIPETGLYYRARFVFFIREAVMAESSSHKKTKAKAAGRRGQTEKKLPGGRRLDAKNPDTNTATEVERSQNYDAALKRLKTQRTAKKKLMVPQKDLEGAAEAARRSGSHDVRPRRILALLHAGGRPGAHRDEAHPDRRLRAGAR